MTDDAGVGYDIANPHPAGTIESLRSLGYSLEAAIADLVDNSIAAAAQQIDVIFTWHGQDSWVAVVDDGEGMDEEQLVTAMTIAARGPGALRTARDLGRFGMGLKTASFSQAGRLIVASTATDGGKATRVWDLDLVKRTEQWRLLRSVPVEDRAILDQLWTGRGTVVLWRHLQRYNLPGLRADDAGSQRHFYDEIRRV
jgi:hypothetical protein